MSCQIQILRSSGRLEPFIEDINQVLEDNLKLIERKIDLESVDIVIADQPSNVIPETGFGGYSPNKNLAYIYTDPGRENFKELLKKELPRTLAHELCHCARWANVGYGETLLEAIVSEGLAEHFDIEINDVEPTRWATALNSKQIQVFLDKAKNHFDDKGYNHSDWFYGSDSAGIPRWTGYTLGFYLVGKYMEKSGKKASELTLTQASDFLA